MPIDRGRRRRLRLVPTTAGKVNLWLKPSLLQRKPRTYDVLACLELVPSDNRVSRILDSAGEYCGGATTISSSVSMGGDDCSLMLNLPSTVASSLSSLSIAPISNLWSLRPGAVLFKSLPYNFL